MMKPILLVLLLVALLTVGGYVLATTDQPQITQLRDRLGLGDYSTLRVDFFDIGQGDGILMQLPNQDQVVIDGGSDNSMVKKVGQAMPFYDRDIELMILTHPHADHITGLIEILRRYHVKKVMMTGVVHTTTEYQEWLDEIKKQQIPVEIIDSNRDIELSDNITLKILFPDHSLIDEQFENLNNSSIVGKLVYAQTSLLLTGDYENEEELIARGVDVRADVLKVGHHGAANANDRDFINAVRPQYAVISAGVDNKFDHPNYRTLFNLEQVKAQIFRTDLQGDIRFISDGQVWRYQTSR